MIGAIRFIMTAIGLVLISIAVGVMLLSDPIRDMARQRLSDTISAHYGADVKIDAIRLAPFDQGIEILGLTVYNPEPFKDEPAIECERILLRANLATLFSPEPVMSSVEIEKPKVTWRYDVGKGSNIAALFANAEAAEAERGPARRKVIVQNCAAKDGKVVLTSNVLLNTPLPVNIAPFSLDALDGPQSLPGWKTSQVFLKTLLMETVTAKGLLNPVADKIREEFGGEGLPQE